MKKTALLLCAITTAAVNSNAQTIRLGLFSELGASMPAGFPEITMTDVNGNTIGTTRPSPGIFYSYGVQGTLVAKHWHIGLGVGRSSYAYKDQPPPVLLLYPQQGPLPDIAYRHKATMIQATLGYAVYQKSRLTLTPTVGATANFADEKWTYIAGGTKHEGSVTPTAYTRFQMSALVGFEADFKVCHNFSVSVMPLFKAGLTDHYSIKDKQTIHYLGGQVGVNYTLGAKKM